MSFRSVKKGSKKVDKRFYWAVKKSKKFQPDYSCSFFEQYLKHSAQTVGKRDSNC